MINFSFELLCAATYSLIIFILNLLLFFFIKNLLKTIILLQKLNLLVEVYKAKNFKIISYLYNFYFSKNQQFYLLKKLGQFNFKDIIIIGNIYKTITLKLKNNIFLNLIVSQYLKEN
jgi:hypothetical protein